MHIDRYLWLIPALPLFGFLVNGLFGARFSKPTIGVVAVLGPLASFVLSVLALLQAYGDISGGGDHGEHGQTLAGAHQVV